MGKPWIGIPTRYHDKTETIGQIRHYLDAVIWAGGLPVMIPTGADRSVICEYVERIDGVLLPGSPTDVEPEQYGAERHPKYGRSYPERDATDFALLDFAESGRLPLLGICFGVQSLNVHRGGTLVQDIPSIVPQAKVHDVDDAEAVPARHPVQLTQGSLLSRLAASQEVEVNSYHHQSIDRPGKDLQIAARAPDGVIEAVEDTTGRFIVGVQWHPERGWRDDGLSQALFRRFIEEARRVRL
jgi:putative glutamine amidotransferase